ncbi:metal-dependent phosphohydrolase [Nanoarchaeota archaeon]
MNILTDDIIVNAKEMELEDVKDVINSVLLDIDRSGIDNLIDFLEFSDYYDAPASTRIDYHGAYEHGLMIHSYNVWQLFRQKVRNFNLDINEQSAAICGLFHDACKINLYIPNELKSGEVSKAKPYVINENFPIGHGEKSLYTLSRYIQLTNQEALIIRWHMTGFDPAWDHYEQYRKIEKAIPEITAFHCADIEASKYLD